MLALGGVAHAEPARQAGDLVLSGSIRLRYEDIHGQLRPGFNRDDDLFSLRTTLQARYAPGPIHVVGEIFDSRAYGGNARTPITNNEVNAVELVQAYVGGEIEAPFGGSGTLTIDAGRMLVNIGSRRLVSADDYRNTTSSSTGIRAQYVEKGRWNGTLIYVLPQLRRPDGLDDLRDNRVAFDRESFDLVLWGGTISRRQAIGPVAAEISFYHLGEDDSQGRPTRNRSLDTVGGRLFRDPGADTWDVEIEGFYQTGSIRASTAANAGTLGVRAWFLHGDAGYSFDAPWKPRLSIEFDQASGDGPGRRFGRFDTLFGLRRAEFAPAGLLSAIGRANILSPGVRIEATPDAAFDWFLSYRPMWLDSQTDSFSTSGVRDPAGASGRFAGHLVDARARYWLVPERLRFEVDGTIVANGRFLQSAPNGTPRDHARYVSLNLTGSF